MHLEARCLNCPDTAPVCTCTQDQTCFLTSRSCDACPQVICQDKQVASTSNGVSKGALAGAVIGVLIFLAAILAALWYRHRRNNNKLHEALGARALEPKHQIDIPASAETVLSRPDPVEKHSSSPTTAGHVRVFSGQSNTTINLQSPSSHADSRENSTTGQSGVEPAIHNPFADQLSIQTTSDQSHSNVIPIALLPYGSVQSPNTQPSQNRDSRGNATSPIPSRPLRSPDLNLRMEDGSPSPPASSFDLTHVNISNDSVVNTRDYQAPSTRSNMSVMSGDSRASYLSTGTYATDLFTESPTIVTRQQGRILGLSKAQVVEVPSSFAGGSPLASSHLTPTTSRMSRLTVARSMKSGRSPLAQSSFTPGDIIEMDEQPEASPFADTNAHPLSPNNLAVTNDDRSVRTNGTFGSNVARWVADDGDVDSIASGIEASIGSAKRVKLGNIGSRAISQTSNEGFGALSTKSARYSFVSEASSRADSILEAFPFVPPSPGTQQSFRSVPLPAQPSSVVAELPTAVDDKLNPPDRRLLGLSTSSHSSNTSSGLEAFPFELQLDSAGDSQSLVRGQQAGRASLDTLALSRDLAAFPLAYDDEIEPTTVHAKYIGTSGKSSTNHVYK